MSSLAYPPPTPDGPVAQDAVAWIGARLDGLGSTRRVWLLVAIISLGGFFEYYEMFATSYVLPGLIHSGMLSATTKDLFDVRGAAFFIASQFFGMFVGTLLLSRIADYAGRRRTFFGAMVFYAFASIGVSLQASAGGLHLWRFITGLGLGVQMITINTLISELVPKYLRGRAFAVNTFLQVLGVPAVATAAWLLVPTRPFGIDGWRWLIASGAVGVIPFLFVRRLIPESPRWLALHGRITEAEAVVDSLEPGFERMRTAPSLPVALDAPAPTLAARPRLAELFGRKYVVRSAMLIVFHICHTVGIYGFQQWAATFLLGRGISLTHSLGYTMVIAYATPFGSLLAISFADRVERKWQIAASAITLGVAGMVFAQASKPILILLSGIVVTMSASILVGAFNVYQAEIFPTRMRAMAVGFVYSWGRLGGVLNGFLIAVTLGRFGVNGVFTLIAGCMAMIVLVIGALGPRTRNRSLEEISY
jgi:putative MFS transporter